MSEMMRTHVLLPKDLVARIDERVGPRRRSEFVADAIEKALNRRRLLELMDAVAEEAKSAPPDDPPEWATSEGTLAWVRAQRQLASDPTDATPER